MSDTAFVDYCGYSQCLKLKNENTRVVIGPHCGGRILEYSYMGENAIYLDHEQDGWIHEKGAEGIDPGGGRLDIGPEMTIPEHPVLWMGKWDAEIVVPGKIRLTSQEDAATGVQLIREFELGGTSSHLRCTQIIKNISKETREWCHWSRTLAKGGGICVVPLTPNSRFPEKYIMYGPGDVMNYRPRNPGIEVRDGFLQITESPAYPKLGLDSYAGWFSYLMNNNLMFVKRFPVYPDRIYNEMAAITVCIYYYGDTFCELEPIGPKEHIEPGTSVAFSEDWWLLPYDYPMEGESLDLKVMEDFINGNAK